jgi:hypothetical protein
MIVSGFLSLAGFHRYFAVRLRRYMVFSCLMCLKLLSLVETEWIS